MMLSKSIFRLAGAEKGTEVAFELNKVTPETKEESESFSDLRERITIGERVIHGKPTTEFSIVSVKTFPFNGRFAFPEKRDGGDLAFMMFSHQAADIAFGEKYGTGCVNQDYCKLTNTSPATNTGGYALLDGEADGNPCIMIFSKDRQRQLIIACHKKKVINSVLEQLLGPAPIDSNQIIDNRTLLELPEFADYNRRWDRIKKEVESLVVNVKTLSQGVNALVKYRNYLEEVEGGQAAVNSRGSSITKKKECAT
jgi:hypothetical protein